MINVAVKSILVTSPILALLQATGAGVPIPEVSWVTQIERLGLMGSLMIAVGVLWRQLAIKDKQVVDALQQVTTAMISGTETSRELRKIIEESVHTKMELKESIDLLSKGIGALPCAMGEVEPRLKR